MMELIALGVLIFIGVALGFLILVVTANMLKGLW